MYPARSRSSMVEGDHRRSRAMIAISILQSTRQFIMFIATTGFVEFISIVAHHWLKFIAFLHFRTQEGKTGFHVSTRRA